MTESAPRPLVGKRSEHAFVCASAVLSKFTFVVRNVDLVWFGFCIYVVSCVEFKKMQCITFREMWAQVFVSLQFCVLDHPKCCHDVLFLCSICSMLEFGNCGVPC